MPTVKRTISTDQPARYLALTAIIVACLAGTLAFFGSSTLAHRAARDEHKNCTDIQAIKTVTRRALGAAIVRAQHALPDTAARASIVELRAEIRLLAPRDCA